MSGGRFDICVARTLGHEGGFSDHKADKGGATNFGITAATLRSAQALGIVPFQVTPRTLTVDQAKKIYFRLYWTAARCPELPAPLDFLLFDSYVNHRPRTAIRLLQEAVGAETDGAIGPETIAKAHAIDPSAAVEGYATARRALFKRIVENDPTQRVFLKGWWNRVDRVIAQAALDVPRKASA